MLHVRSVSKQFPGVRALQEVSLSLGRGEVLAIVGENGAGKSTLMKILAGVIAPDSGELQLDDEPLVLESPRHAIERGIALIHQELNLADNLDVAANIFLGREPCRAPGWIDRRRLEAEAATWLKVVGLDVTPRAIAGTLSIGRRQMVEIAKALSTHARVIIMDEPTSSLTQHETHTLFGVVRGLKARGVSVIYISHRLGEVAELADRVVVLRDGRNAGELGRSEITHDAMVRLMVGRDVSQIFSHAPGRPGEPALRVCVLRTPAYPACPVSFDLRAGEIVGLAGLVGAGRTELLETIFGITPAAGGMVQVGAGEAAPPFSHPLAAIRAGLGLAPEDRKQAGLILEMSVRDNLALASLRRDCRPGGFLNRAAALRRCGEMVRTLAIRTPHERQQAQYLSGGNQQKVVLGKWLTMNPRVLLLDEPTRGIDVGAKQEIYRLMEELAARGVAILFASSEMEEILSMSDRALVMHEGRITGELSRSELSEQAVIGLMTGQSKAA